MAARAGRDWWRRRPRPGRRSRRDRALAAVAAALCAAPLWVIPGPAAVIRAASEVDLELVLAFDCSYRVSDVEFALQLGGLAGAFRDPVVLAAIAVATPRGVAVSLVQWSGRDHQREVVPWTHVADAAAALALADRIEGAPRAVPEGPTGLGEAIDLSIRLLLGNGIEGARRVIDVSGDGRRNTGVDPAHARDRAIAAGITVNGLAIVIEDPALDAYYRARVIGGAGAFLLTARDFDDFARAMRLKLHTEIRNSPVERERGQVGTMAARLEQYIE